MRIIDSILILIEEYQKKIITTLSVLIITLYIFVPVHKEMHPTWSVPYFSGAVNSDSFKDWKFAPEEIDNYKKLSWNEKLNYQFKKYPQDKLETYEIGYKGFLYVVKFIHFIAPTIPIVKAIKTTQVLLQLFIIGIITWLLSGSLARVIFLIIYGLNPVVFIFTKMPIYYFWQVIPSAIFILIFLKNKKIHPVLYFIFGFILGISMLVRITIIGMILSIFVLLLTRKELLKATLLLVSLVISLFILSPNREKGVGNFHTPFIGIGAYSNHLGLDKLSDDEGVNFYKRVKDPTFSFSLGGGYNNREKREDYLRTLKEVYIDYIKKYPLEIIRNATLNTIQGYSFGHFPNKGIVLNSISFVGGLVMIILLLYFKEYILFITLGLSIGTVSLFFPPIQSYMFGSYLIISIAIVTVFLRFLKISDMYES